MRQSTFSAGAFPYLHRDGKYARTLNRTRDLAQNIASIKREALRDEYQRLVRCAPRRADRGKSYFVGHNGVPSGTRASNRFEEHLAMALWNLKKSWPRRDGDLFGFLDYQFPLRARSSDKGIGEVDLLGVTNQGRLIVIELKVKPDGDNNRGETPVSALIQALRYAAIVQANQGAIAEELKPHVAVTAEPPIVQVLAPHDWWRAWLNLRGSTRSAAGSWEVAFSKLAKDVEEQIDVPVECAKVEAVRLSSGGDGQKPQLKSTPEFRYLRLGS